MTCRIKHYDKDRYRPKRKKPKDAWLGLSAPNKENEDKVRSYVWHPFALDPWCVVLRYPTSKVVTYGTHGVRLDSLFEYPANRNKKSITLKMGPSLEKYIRNCGWPVYRRTGYPRYTPIDHATSRYQRRLHLSEVKHEWGFSRVRPVEYQKTFP